MPSLLLSLVWTPEARRTLCRGPAVECRASLSEAIIAIEQTYDTEQTQIMQALSCIESLRTRHDLYHRQHVIRIIINV
jgi:hypothetical protein